MSLIPTSAADISKMRKAAKLLVRSNSTLKHADALDQIAKVSGYDHWKHVMDCTNFNPPMASNVPLNFDQLGFLPDFQEVLLAAIRRGGMCVVSGQAKSGRTTTLNAILNRDASLKGTGRWLSFEGESLKASEHENFRRRLFRTAIVGCLFDNNALGWLPLVRDIVETGHSAFMGVRSNSTLDALQSIGRSGVPVDTLRVPGNLAFMLHQQLFPRNCPHCSHTTKSAAVALELDRRSLGVWDQRWSKLEATYGVSRELFRLRHPKGCDYCGGTGSTGYVMAYEFIEPDREFLNAIRNGVPLPKLRAIWKSWSNSVFDSTDMRGKSLTECAMYKASFGLIDPRHL